MFFSLWLSSARCPAHLNLVRYAARQPLGVGLTFCSPQPVVAASVGWAVLTASPAQRRLETGAGRHWGCCPQSRLSRHLSSRRLGLEGLPVGFVRGFLLGFGSRLSLAA